MASRPPARRRVSRQRYLARRVAVGAVLVLLVLLGVRGLSAVMGGDGGEADATTTAPQGVADGASAPPTTLAQEASTAPTTTVADTTTTSEATTTTRPERTGPPSQAEPARVLIVGDSDAGTFGPYLEQLLDGTKIVETDLDYKVSSGLARPDFFDWPEALAEKVPAVDPDIVVVTFGGNDAQGLSEPGDELNFIIGDPVANEAEWSEEYTRRASDVMEMLLEDDRAVIWVGIPNDNNPDVTAKMAIQDQAAKAAAAQHEDVVFVDTWKRFSGRDGNWAEFVIDPRDGTGKDVRADDGFHLNVAGAEILAIDIAQAVRDELEDMGAEI